MAVAGSFGLVVVSTNYSVGIRAVAGHFGNAMSNCVACMYTTGACAACLYLYGPLH